MNDEAMSGALDAICEEAEKLLEYELPREVEEKIELIISIARYKFDVRTDKEALAQSPKR